MLVSRHSNWNTNAQLFGNVYGARRTGELLKRGEREKCTEPENRTKKEHAAKHRYESWFGERARVRVLGCDLGGFEFLATEDLPEPDTFGLGWKLAAATCPGLL
jgi:hypothetical protein